MIFRTKTNLGCAQLAAPNLHCTSGQIYKVYQEISLIRKMMTLILGMGRKGFQNRPNRLYLKAALAELPLLIID
jgi:hypothetical protein